MLKTLRPFILVIGAGLIALSLSRVGLSIWQHERLLATPDWPRVFLNGLRIDAATLVYVTLVPFWLVNLAGLTTLFRHSALWLSKVWLMTGVLMLIFFELITPNFIAEYSLRPNQLFLNYIIYPKEVTAMLLEGYKLEIVVVLSCFFAAAYVVRKQLGNAMSREVFGKWYVHALVLILITPLLLITGRSSFGHRALNPAMVAFAPDPLVNQLTLNSTYNVAYALYSKQSEKSAAALYGHLDASEVLKIVQAGMADGATAVTPNGQMERDILPVYAGKKRNIVILLQESLGARFVGKLSGGAGHTPMLDRLMDEGWNFTRFFATGTRSVRGLEAITTGFPPGPAEAIIKLPEAQQHFFTIFSLLGAQGYHTQFIYGGEAHFDNMKGFFYANGVKEVVDLPKFRFKNFVGSWGASDEDLYQQAHHEYDRLAAAGKPFVSLVFTSTNHTPFEFPDGRISVTGEKQTRENAIRYSDWALGEFFKKAKQSSYWNDTIFIVVADHDARIYENDLLPIKSFHIPALILGSGITPRQDPQLASSLDVVPTLLSLAGIQGKIPTIGRDLNRPNTLPKARAMMQFDQHYGYLKDGQLTVLVPEKPAISYSVDMKSLALSNPQTDPASGREALAHVLWAELAYRQKLYRSQTAP